MIRRKAKLTYGANPNATPPVLASVKDGWILGWWVTQDGKFQFAWEDGQDKTFSVADLDYEAAAPVSWTFEDGQPDPLPTVD